MTAVPGFVGLAGDGSLPQAPPPLFALFNFQSGPATQILDAAYRYAGEAYFFCRSDDRGLATPTNDVCAATLRVFDDSGDTWILDKWVPLAPYQTPRHIIVPPMKLKLYLETTDGAAHRFWLSLTPRYSPVGTPTAGGG